MNYSCRLLSNILRFAKDCEFYPQVFYRGQAEGALKDIRPFTVCALNAFYNYGVFVMVYEPVPAE
jgi:hypothetical protein